MTDLWLFISEIAESSDVQAIVFGICILIAGALLLGEREKHDGKADQQPIFDDSQQATESLLRTGSFGSQGAIEAAMSRHTDMRTNENGQ